MIIKKKKIGIFIPGLAGGGAERFAVNLANTLYKNEYNVIIITNYNEDNEYWFNENIDRVVIDSAKSGLLKAMDIANKIRKLSNEESIDMIIAIDIYANLCACMSNHHMKTKVCISERNAPKQVSISLKSRMLRKILYRKADCYVFQTEGARSFYSKKIQERSTVIPNPVKDNLPYRDCHNIKKEIIAVGRLESQKNYANLIKAFSIVLKKHNDYKLKIFGCGSEEDKLIDLCRSLEIDDKVEFKGFCLDVHSEIVNSDIYVLSSDYEGMPNSLLEAMAMGFPVVSTDCPAGGPASIIKHGVNGMLVKIDDANALAECLDVLIQKKDLKERIAVDAQKVRNDFSSENVFSMWKEFIESDKNNI